MMWIAKTVRSAPHNKDNPACPSAQQEWTSPLRALRLIRELGDGDTDTLPEVERIRIFDVKNPARLIEAYLR